MAITTRDAALTESEKKFIKALASLTPSRKRWLNQYHNLYLVYRDRTTDRSISYWKFMHFLARAWYKRWSPPHWKVWRWNMQAYWKNQVQEAIIRYYDWKSGTIHGLRKLDRQPT